MDGGDPVPRTIWFLWLQGLDQAPEIVRACHATWVARNPGWRVEALDAESLRRFATLDLSAPAFARLSANHRSDLLRLDLLARHGGVWVDATCLCVQPLDDWLPANLASGFFAFAQPTRDRPFGSWFLAARPGNPLVVELRERLLGYWSGPPRRESGRAHRLVSRLLAGSPRRRSWWFRRPVADWLRVTPYFALHHAFEKLVYESPAARRVWAETPKLSATGPLRPLFEGLGEPVSASLRAEIDRRALPLYKVTWKVDGRVAPASTLGYLLESLRP